MFFNCAHHIKKINSTIDFWYFKVKIRGQRYLYTADSVYTLF